MIPVRFKVGQAPYNAGEIAGFPPEVAERLISAGVAEAYVAEVRPPEVTKAIEAPPVDKMVRSATHKAGGTRKK
ncbi:MAG: hypothetical protein QME79_12280 [Bacillota bacterium]|nr:hypothetical protein [Bacillota bacterium]